MSVTSATESKYVHFWPDSHVDQLRAMWGKMSAAEIAGHILGDPGKKNSVIGKAHRLGLPRLKLTDVRLYRPLKPATKRIPNQSPKPRKQAVKMEEINPADMSMISIVELNDMTCHWPVGDPREADFAYCGLPKDAACKPPYCSHHLKISMASFERVFACP